MSTDRQQPRFSPFDPGTRGAIRVGGLFIAVLFLHPCYVWVVPVLRKPVLEHGDGLLAKQI